MPGINIQTCDITDDDRLYKLAFEYYYLPYKISTCSKFKILLEKICSKLYGTTMISAYVLC